MKIYFLNLLIKEMMVLMDYASNLR